MSAAVDVSGFYGYIFRRLPDHDELRRGPPNSAGPVLKPRLQPHDRHWSARPVAAARSASSRLATARARRLRRCGEMRENLEARRLSQHRHAFGATTGPAAAVQPPLPLRLVVIAKVSRCGITKPSYNKPWMRSGGVF
jgi:hypothetical protein